jgi:hypothetical protein
MIRMTRAMMQQKPASVKSILKGLYRENQELRALLLSVQQQIERGAGTAHLHQVVENGLLQLDQIDLDLDVL